MIANLATDKTKSHGPRARPADSAREQSAPPANLLWQSLALRPFGVQPKLAVSSSSDPEEREADRVADQVMSEASTRSPLAGISITNASASAQRKCRPCEEEKEAKVQFKEQPGAHNSTALNPAAVRHVLDQPGDPLGSNTRSFFEPRLGHDLSHVRVHVGAQAAASARALNATAYTLGQDIVFAPAKYAPRTTAGKRLLAHELAHVVQHNTTRASVQRELKNAGDETNASVSSPGARHLVGNCDSGTGQLIIQRQGPVASGLEPMSPVPTQAAESPQASFPIRPSGDPADIPFLPAIGMAQRIDRYISSIDRLLGMDGLMGRRIFAVEDLRQHLEGAPEPPSLAQTIFETAVTAALTHAGTTIASAVISRAIPYLISATERASVEAVTTSMTSRVNLQILLGRSGIQSGVRRVELVGRPQPGNRDWFITEQVRRLQVAASDMQTAWAGEQDRFRTSPTGLSEVRALFLSLAHSLDTAHDLQYAQSLGAWQDLNASSNTQAFFPSSTFGLFIIQAQFPTDNLASGPTIERSTLDGVPPRARDYLAGLPITLEDYGGAVRADISTGIGVGRDLTPPIVRVDLSIYRNSLGLVRLISGGYGDRWLYNRRLARTGQRREPIPAGESEEARAAQQVWREAYRISAYHEAYDIMHTTLGSLPMSRLLR